MLIKSSPLNRTIPYHDKVINKVKTTIAKIDPFLLNFNWIISGSFAVNSLYFPNKIYNDIDFYFSNEEDYFKCLNYLTSKFPENTHETDHAVTFNSINIQLVKKWFLPPEELIYTHDFTNVSVAITQDEIYLTKETNFAWYNEQIDLRNFQISTDPPATDFEKVLALNLLLRRTEKYVSRYDLSLSPSYQKFLFEQKDFLQSLDSTQITIEETQAVNYYGTLVSHQFTVNDLIQNLNSILNIQENQNLTWDINF